MNHKNNPSKTNPVAGETKLSLREQNDLKFRSKPKTEQLATFERYVNKYQPGNNFLLDSVLEYDLTGEFINRNDMCLL